MLKEYLNIAFNNIRRRRLRSYLTMIGIFIGIASVVSLIGLGEGLRTAIMGQFGFLGTDMLSVTATGGFGPPGTGVINPLSDKEINEIERVSGVKAVAGRILESGKLVFNNKVAFGYAASIPDKDGRKLMEHVMNMEAEKGRLLQDGDKGAIFLGNDFMQEDNPFGKAIIPGSKVEVNEKEFEVIGIMEKKGNFQLDGTVFMNDDDLRELVNRPKDEYDIIAIQFDENGDAGKIKADIEKKIRKVRGVDEGEEDFSVSSPDSVIEGVNSTLLAVQIFVYIIASISLLVGGIGIMNTMYTAVVERTKEIGIMKSIGARNRTVFTLFFIESGLLGSVGGIIGATLGFLLAKGLAFIGKFALGSDLIQAHISFFLMFGAILFAFVIGSFFGTLPAIRASKLNPVDALRFAK